VGPSKNETPFLFSAAEIRIGSTIGKKNHISRHTHTLTKEKGPFSPSLAVATQKGDKSFASLSIFGPFAVQATTTRGLVYLLSGDFVY
jgi:hypothetical protein